MDNEVFEALGTAPPGDLFNALRFFNHISSFSEVERKAFRAAGKSLDGAAAAPAPAAAAATAAADNDDDFDLFDDEDDEAVEKRNAERVAAYQAKKAKSNISKLIFKKILFSN